VSLTLEVLWTFLGVEVEYVDGTLCQTTGKVVAAVGKTDVTAAFKVLERVKFFYRITQHVHHDDLISVCDNDMETRRMESNSVHFLAYLCLHLDF